MIRPGFRQVFAHGPVLKGQMIVRTGEVVVVWVALHHKDHIGVVKLRDVLRIVRVPKHGFHGFLRLGDLAAQFRHSRGLFLHLPLQRCLLPRQQGDGDQLQQQNQRKKLDLLPYLLVRDLPISLKVLV